MVALIITLALASPGDAGADARPHWAYEPPHEPAAPALAAADLAWCRSPLDALVRAPLAAAGLRPAPEADRRTLVRRVTYDLTGLPPDVEEIDAFLADDAPDAFARLVDRLLASPRHGEKWGRHWLDVARYADSNGLDENLAYANAFRYRDRVIDSFNADTPFDRFIHEQIAGDLLPQRPGESEEERLARIVATGFLSIGPKMLACDDGRKMELDIVDEQVDTVCRAFMGVTMGCARCHDHKFDPFSMADYYALAGIFKSTKTMENFNVVAEWHEHEVATAAERARRDAHEAAIAERERLIGECEEAARREFLDAERRKAGEYVRAAVAFLLHGDPTAPDGVNPVAERLGAENLGGRGALFEAEAFQRGTLTVDTTTWGPGIGVLLHHGYAEYDLELPAGRYQLELRYAALESRPVTISLDGEVITEDGAAAVTGGWHPPDQRWRVEGVLEIPARRCVLRVERSKGPVPHLDKVALVRFAEERAEGADAAGGGDADGDDAGTLPRTIPGLVAALGVNEAILRQWVEFLGARRAAADATWTALEALDDAARAESAETVGGIREAIADASNGPFRLPEKPERFFGAERRATLARLVAEKKELEASRPVLARAMGVREGTVEDLRIHERGDYLTLGEEAPRRFPRVLGGDDAPPITKDRSGRLELARWLTRSDHPLTARVIANRVWLWHFGAGLVRSPDNFGSLGDRPANQPVLDWLARRLVDDGWSLKALHRRLLLSATWAMSTAFDERAHALDPENRLLWRFERRRLTAEEVRDAMLALGGDLDLAMYGQLLPDKRRDYVTGTASMQHTYDSNRRSVYLPVLRSAVYQVLQTWDFPDPAVSAGERAESTVAPQALFMMNGALALDASRRLAARLVALGGDSAGRVERAFLEAFGRRPHARELVRCLESVETFARELEAEERESPLDGDEILLRSWQSLCRVLIASNEFVYLE